MKKLNDNAAENKKETKNKTMNETINQAENHSRELRVLAPPCSLLFVVHDQKKILAETQGPPSRGSPGARIRADAR